MTEPASTRRWLWRAPLTPPVWNALTDRHGLFHAADAVIAASVRRTSGRADGGLARKLPPPRSYVPGIHHPLTVKFPPVAAPIDLVRSRMERHAVSSIMRETGGAPLALPAIELVRTIARHLVGGDAFRTTQISTDQDPVGRHVVFPGPEHIVPQFARLDRFLAESSGAAFSFRAMVAALMVLNCHALHDGNGRVSRVMFNLVACPQGPASGYYLPLYEIGVFARGGYIVRLRQAELHGDWAPLAEYVLAAARFWERQQVAGAPASFPPAGTAAPISPGSRPV